MARQSEQLERQADRTRAQLADTLEELRSRLSPSQFVEELMDYTEGDAAELARNLGRDLRDNPLPMTLVAVGLAWLMTKNARPAQSEGAGGEARASEGAASADAIGRGVSDSGRLLAQFCREQPLLLAGLGLAAGAAVGALLAPTDAGRQSAEEASRAAEGGAEPATPKRMAKEAGEAEPAPREGYAAPPSQWRAGERPVTRH